MFTTGCGDAGAQDARRMEAAAEEEEEPELLSWGIWEEEEERRGTSPGTGTSHACLEFCSLHSRGVSQWRLEWRREVENSRARDGRGGGPPSPAPLIIFLPH